MAISDSPMGLCALNINKFIEINAVTQDTEATLLYSKILFHSKNSLIKKDGVISIARSRSELASWFNLGIKKVDRALESLSGKNLIKKACGMWYGKKKLFLSPTASLSHSPINMRTLSVLNNYTTSTRRSIILSFIAFKLANTTIIQDNKKWAVITKKDLAKKLALSERSIFNELKALEDSGLILKEHFYYKNRLKLHVHIPQEMISSISNAIKDANQEKSAQAGPAENKANSQICQAKTVVSIKKRTKKNKVSNNITNTELSSKPQSTKKAESNCDISFNEIGSELTKRQIAFLTSAIERTTDRNLIKISNPKEVFEQISFSILNKEQRKGVISFRHAVSRYMKILASGNWKTPKGFRNHSDAGKLLLASQERRARAWKEEKKREIESSQQAKDLFENALSADRTTKSFDKYTSEAVELANQVTSIVRRVDDLSQNKAAYGFVSDLMSKIKGLVRCGANRAAVDAVLQSP